jgi:hypothetical protein
MSKRHADAADAGAGGAGAAGGAATDGGAPPTQSAGKQGKFRKEKPWDVDGIDHWCARTLRASGAGLPA